MRRSLVGLSILAVMITATFAPHSSAEDRDTREAIACLPVPNGGFESGLSLPWGSGQLGDGRHFWEVSGGCRSTVEADRRIHRSGAASLHVTNQSSRAPNVFGTTQQPIAIEPGESYRITLWARARGLASDRAVNIAVDEAWRVRPISLPGGSYDWTKFTGEFSLPASTAQLRILIEDRGEVWIDDVQIEILEPGPSPQELAETTARLKRIGRAAAAFRQAALEDYEEALGEYASPAARDRFRRLDEHVWPASEPRLAWSYFFNVSVLTAVDEPARQPLLAFYNPWSDVFLITVWEAEGGFARIIDVEMLPGDWVREPGRLSEVPTPLWLRGDMYRPVAVGRAVCRSVDAFRSAFAGADAGNWRTRLAVLDDDSSLIRKSYETVALRSAGAMLRVQDFWNPSPEEPASLALLRSRTVTAIRLLAEGRIQEVLDVARETLPATQGALRAADADKFRMLTVVSTVVGPLESMVFLGSKVNSNGFVSIHVGRDGDPGVLRRIDVVDYAAARQVENNPSKLSHTRAPQ